MPNSNGLFVGQTIRSRSYVIKLLKKVDGKDEWVVLEMLDRGFFGTKTGKEKTMTEQRLLEIIADTAVRNLNMGLDRRTASTRQTVRKPISPERLAMLKRAKRLADLVPKTT